MISFEEIERKLKSYLRPASVPSVDDIWHDLKNALGRQRLRHRMPALKVALAVAALLITTTGLALAASPPLREQIETAVGIKGGRGGISSIQPTPLFQIFQPTLLPQGMQLRVTAYNPGPGSDTKPRVTIMLSAAVRSEGSGSYDPAVQAAKQRASHLLSEGGGARLVLIYGADQDNVVEVVERAADSRSLPEGIAATVHKQPAVFSQRDGREVLAWIEQGTLVEIYANLDRVDTLRVAEGLRKTDLTALQPRTSSAQTLTDTPPAWVRTPWAQRVDSVQRSTVSHDAIVQQCGRWNDTRTTYGAQTFDQAICAARVAASVNVVENYGLDRSQWLDLAQRLKVDPALVPDGNRLVWVVQLNISQAGGSVVVIDVETGQPYMVVTLRPVNG